MKRRLLFMTMFLLFVVFEGYAMQPNQIQQPKEKSESEKFVQSLSRIKSDEINYAYISLNMLRQMFLKLAGNGNMAEMKKMFGSLKSVRRFVTTGEEGYKALKSALSPFLQEEETVMGMELMVLNRDEVLSVVYSGSENVLIITDCCDDEISLVFFTGLSYEAFLKMNDGGIEFDFGF